ncbi:unnamed protein product [Durusdinium trenchii]|uniref:Uncharacterized protein n=1 Tax=Durusdinium trenchii TaxID=1381693 RepID=A0ABP0SH31_9DINO
MTPTQFDIFVKRLIALKTPKVVVLLVLLTWWLDLPGRDGPPYQVLEYFAGVGRVAAMAKFAGFKAAAIDIEYGKSLGKERGSRCHRDLFVTFLVLWNGALNQLSGMKRKRYFVSVGGVIERMDLPSRVFSTGTLMAGVDLVNEETGMDTLNDKSDEDLQRELAELETLLQDKPRNAAMAVPVAPIPTPVRALVNSGDAGPEEETAMELTSVSSPFQDIEAMEQAASGEAPVTPNEMKKLRRMMTPRADGSLLDTFMKKCKKKVQFIEEQDLWVNDPTILIEADGTDNQHKTLKLLNFPVMDDADALASSYIPRVLTCLSKWGVKIQSMMEVLESVEDLSDNLRQLLDRAREIEKNLQAVTERVTTTSTEGILAGYKKDKKYQSTPGLLLSILHCISEDLRQLCTDGVKRPEGTYKFALLGFKGDLEYVAKCGMLSRSYQNVGHVNQIACCSDCKAGLPQYPFEDFTARAQWKRTVHIEVPWTAIPPFAPIAFEPWNSGKASMWFRGDPFHIFRLGIARNFIGSTIVMLAHEGHFDDTTDASESRALKARLERGWASFALWCHTHRETPAGLRSFSIQKLHMPTQGSFPYIGCKGSDTILLLRWLQWFTGLALISHPADNTLTLMLRGCQGGLSFQKIHNHGLWLRRQCRFNIHRSIKTFLSAYGHLARIAQNKRYTLYSMVPKAHALDHIADFIQRSNGNEYVLNPCTFDCSMAEDYIGRLARQSRRVSAKNCVSNTLLAYKVKARMQILRHKRARNL